MVPAALEAMTEQLAIVGKDLNGIQEVLRVRDDDPDGEQLLPEVLPMIVIVVDEFADLMMQQGKEVEACVARLAQKARAAGMHVILATQRPSVDVITGMIKANFPTRIAYRVAQKIDSRTILDEQGAEHLLGKGGMAAHFFQLPGHLNIHACVYTIVRIYSQGRDWKIPRFAAPRLAPDQGKKRPRRAAWQEWRTPWPRSWFWVRVWAVRSWPMS